MRGGLSKGWESRPLGEVCSIVSGSTPKTDVAEYWEGDIPWLTPDDLSRHTSKYVSGGRRALTKAGYESCSTRMVPTGAVLYSSRAPIGYAAIASRPLCTNQGFKTAIPSDRLISDFLYWQLLERTEDVRRRASGTTFKEISGKAFAQTELVLPPLNEQHRIVAVLEDHLSRLDAALVELDNATRRSAALLRRAGLDLLREAAPQKAVGAVTELSIGGVWGAAPGGDDVEVDVARVTELRPMGRLDMRTAARRSVTSRQLATRQLQVGDLLLEKSGGGPNTPVGRVGLVDRVPEQATVCSNFMQLLRPAESLVRPRYLHLVLNALHALGGTAHLQTASTNIRNIKASEYLQLEIPCPSLERQDDMIEQVLAVQQAVERVRAEVARRRGQATALRRALLGAAFSGLL